MKMFYLIACVRGDRGSVYIQFCTGGSYFFGPNTISKFTSYIHVSFIKSLQILIMAFAVDR